MAEYNAAEPGRGRLDMLAPMSVHSDAEYIRVTDLNYYTHPEASRGWAMDSQC
jgi:hypothetical protein